MQQDAVDESLYALLNLDRHSISPMHCGLLTRVTSFDAVGGASCSHALFTCPFDFGDHGGDVVEARLVEQELPVAEVTGELEALRAQEVEDVSEDASVAIDEVVLLEGVEDDRDASVKHLC